MEEKYKNYVESFNGLDIFDKRSIIVENLEELIKLFHKVNVDFNNEHNILPVYKESETEDEYLSQLFTYIISLKEISADTVNLLLENMYDGDANE